MANMPEVQELALESLAARYDSGDEAERPVDAPKLTVRLKLPEGVAAATAAAAPAQAAAADASDGSYGGEEEEEESYDYDTDEDLASALEWADLREGEQPAGGPRQPEGAVCALRSV